MTKSEMTKELKSIHGHLKKALDRSEKLAKKVDGPSYTELYFITEEVGKLLEMASRKEK